MPDINNSNSYNQKPACCTGSCFKAFDKAVTIDLSFHSITKITFDLSKQLAPSQVVSKFIRPTRPIRTSRDVS